MTVSVWSSSHSQAISGVVRWFVGAQSRVGEFQKVAVCVFLIAFTLMAFISCPTLEDIVIDWLGKA